MRTIVRSPRPWLETTEQHVADITRDDLADAVAGASTIVHLAGPNEVVASRDPEAATHVTVEGTRRIVDAARHAGVDRFVYVSTMHVYGASLEPGRTITEDTPPAPRHPYAVARLASEELLAASDGIEALVLRLTTSVGAPAHPAVDRWSLVANDLCREAVLSGTLTLQTDGSQWRDFIALAEVSRIIAAIVAEPVPAGTYNLGSGEPWTVRQLAERIGDAAERVLGTRPDLIAPPPADTISEPYVIDVAKLADVGHRPRAGVDGAIEETLRFCADWRPDIAAALGADR